MTLLISKKLKYFVTCFESRCINSAADLLCITRSPLSRVIYELEEKTGGRLFVRKYNNLEPTETAISLYEKVKPIYELLHAIEIDFNFGKDKGIGLLCDLSVPYVIYQHIESTLKLQHYSVKCLRQNIESSEMKSLIANPNTIVLSFRNICFPDCFAFHKIADESMYLFIPEAISDKDLTDYNITKDIKLFIKKDIFSAEVKTIVTRTLKDTIPYVEIKESTYDTLSQLMHVAAGEAMMILPKCLTPYFSPPKTRMVKLQNIHVQVGIYVNVNFKNKTDINKLINAVSSSIIWNN